MGDGGGGNGLAVVRARLATRPLTRRDFSSEMLDRWPRGRPVQMRLRVDAEGRVIQCIVDIGTGDPQLDATVCATAQARLRLLSGGQSRRAAGCGLGRLWAKAAQLNYAKWMPR